MNGLYNVDHNTKNLSVLSEILGMRTLKQTNQK